MQYSGSYPTGGVSKHPPRQTDDIGPCKEQSR